TADDGDRITRLVTRRCAIHFIETRPAQVIVHFWGKMADLRPLFKRLDLAKNSVKVALRERKHESVIVTSGAEFLSGNPTSEKFVKVFQAKWGHRFTEQRDDVQAASWSWSNFCWPGVEPGRIPWTVLKSAWQPAQSPSCPNCDQ